KVVTTSTVPARNLLDHSDSFYGRAREIAAETLLSSATTIVRCARPAQTAGSSGTGAEPVEDRADDSADGLGHVDRAADRPGHARPTPPPPSPPPPPAEPSTSPAPPTIPGTFSTIWAAASPAPPTIPGSPSAMPPAISPMPWPIDPATELPTSEGA